MEILEFLRRKSQPETKIESQTQINHKAQTISTVSTTELSKIVGFNLSFKFLNEINIKPFAQTKNGFFWAVEDIPYIFMTLSKHFSQRAKEELNKP